MIRRVAVPSAVTDQALLDRVDYQDTFCLDGHGGRSPEACLHAVIAGAPPGVLPAVRLVHGLMGARLHTTDHDHPLGWTILRSEPQLAVLGTDGAGMSGRIVGTVEPDGLMVTTQLRFHTTTARLLFATVVGPAHRTAVPLLLGRACVHGV